MIQDYHDISEYIASFLPLYTFLFFGTLCKTCYDVIKRPRVVSLMLRRNFPETFVIEATRLGMEDLVFSPYITECERYTQMRKYGQTTLTQFSENGKFLGTKILCRLGIVYEINREHTYDAMKSAAVKGHDNIVRLLCDYMGVGKGITMSEEEQNQVISILKAAAKCGRESIVRYLCESGVHELLTQEEMSFLFMCTADNGHEGVVRLFCYMGVHEFDRYFTSAALKYAAENGYESIVRLFCNLGVHEYDLERTSFALLAAVENAHENIVRFLCDLGAHEYDLELTSIAFSVALEDGNESIANMMKAKHAWKK
jgi:hypothetical protein